MSETQQNYKDKVMMHADAVKGAIQIENYANADFSVDSEYVIDALLYDTILLQLVDGDLNSKMSNGIFIPTDVTNRKVWRTGKVIMAGSRCNLIKEGDYVVFPSDKGIITKSITIDGYGTLRDCMFIAEDRIFARAKRIENVRK
jgi:co-chaperonin GroES (HSP10)